MNIIPVIFSSIALTSGTGEVRSFDIPKENNAKVFYDPVTEKPMIQYEGHTYTVDFLIHSEFCDCEWWNYDY